MCGLKIIVKPTVRLLLKLVSLTIYVWWCLIAFGLLRKLYSVVYLTRLKQILQKHRKSTFKQSKEIPQCDQIRILVRMGGSI